jgi:putative zinc finger/helix-turn-helix YgiT family protein
MPRGETDQSTQGVSRCLECGETSVSKVTQDHEHKFTYEGRKYRVQISQLPVIKCGACGQASFDQDALQILLDAEYFRLNILQPREIVEARERNGFSQRGLAALLGIGVATLSRWEKGHLRQSRAMDNLLRLALFDQACREQLALGCANTKSLHRRAYCGHLEREEGASTQREVRYIDDSRVSLILEDGQCFCLREAWSYRHAS